MLAVDESTREQIHRILQSNTLRSSENLRRLLQFLADKSLSGEAEVLKEYSIGIDAFGKPASYDPRHDSTVRIQAGRLRQKLMEYYQTEGSLDPVVIDLPKGAFRLSWHPRPPASLAESAVTATPLPVLTHTLPPAPSGTSPRKFTLVLVASLVVVFVWAAFATTQWRRLERETAVFAAQWTPELQTLWNPFVVSDRPLLVSISAPLFFEFPGYGSFRDATVDRPASPGQSANLTALQRAFNGTAPQPLIYFTTIGDAHVSFSLGRLLAARKANVSMVNGGELSWRQVSENNVIYVGSPKFFNQQLGSMPVRTELYLEPRVGVHNLHPREQELTTYADEYVNGRTTGTAYTLISHTPGPLGKGDVISFAGRNGAGILGAVGVFTEASGARTILGRLRLPSGEIPRYYQVLLKVRFQDGVPLETSYVLHRDLMTVGAKQP